MRTGKPAVLIGGMPLMLRTAVANDLRAAPVYTQKQKDDAMRWADTVSMSAFESRLPNATSMHVHDPLCRVITLRSQGSSDSLDYEVVISERCDGAIAGTVVIPDGDSLFNQLARLKLADPSISAERALSRLKVRTTELKAATAARLLSAIDRTRVALAVSRDIYFDARMVEVASNSGGLRKIVAVWAVKQDRDGKAVSAIADVALSAAGLAPESLRIDATYWSREN